MVICRSCADNLLWGYGLCRPPAQNFGGGDRPPCPPLDYARVYKLWPKAARGQLVSWERHSQLVFGESEDKTFISIAVSSRQSVSSYLIRQSTVSYSWENKKDFVNYFNAVHSGSPSSSVHRRLPSVFLFIVFSSPSSSPVFCSSTVRRPSSTVFCPPSVYRRLQSVIRPFCITALPTSTQRFARQPDRASSSSVVSQAVQRAVVCWSEEDNETAGVWTHSQYSAGPWANAAI